MNNNNTQEQGEKKVRGGYECPACFGTGQSVSGGLVFDEPCPDCRGSGWVYEDEEEVISQPEGGKEVVEIEDIPDEDFIRNAPRAVPTNWLERGDEDDIHLAIIDHHLDQPKAEQQTTHGYVADVKPSKCAVCSTELRYEDGIFFCPACNPTPSTKVTSGEVKAEIPDEVVKEIEAWVSEWIMKVEAYQIAAIAGAQWAYKQFASKLNDNHVRIELYELRDAVGQQADKIKELEAENERLLDTLHIDRSGLAHGLAQMVKTVEGYHWITEGRGPYAYNDDEYRKEAGYMLDKLLEIANDALRKSGNLAHAECCGRQKRETILEEKDATIALQQKEIEGLKGEVSRKKLRELEADVRRLEERHKNQRQTIEEFQNGLSFYLLGSKLGISFFGDAEKYLQQQQSTISAQQKEIEGLKGEVQGLTAELMEVRGVDE